MVPNVSQLQRYSLGIVAMNKEMSEKFIEVYPYEINPTADGEITDAIEKYKAKGTDANGSSFEVELETTLTIRAKWLPIGQTHRITAPDVRRGEKVELWRFGDSDQFFWIEFDQGENIRRLETVIWSFSNVSKEGEAHNAENTYWLELSTHGKYVHFHTSKNDKEPFIYDFQFNTKDGIVTLQDDDENWIFLNSKERHIQIHNRDNSFMEVNKENITHRCNDTILLDCDKLIIKAKSSIDATTKKWTDQTDTYDLKADTHYKATTPDMLDKAEKYERDGKESTIKQSEDYKMEIKRDMKIDIKRDYRLKAERDYYAEITFKWKTKLLKPLPQSRFQVEFALAEFSGNIEVAGEIKGQSYKGGHHD